jgi:hypothetical protein
VAIRKERSFDLTFNTWDPTYTARTAVSPDAVNYYVSFGVSITAAGRIAAFVGVPDNLHQLGR